jgi:serine/threonine protein kinase
MAEGPDMFDLAGKTLSKYRLLEKSGQGGMAQVYKAYHPDLDRYVAIKVLHPHLTADEDFSARC